MDLAAEHDARDRPTDQGRCDVVEERRQYKDHHQQHEAALPIIGQQLRQPRRQPARFEMFGQQREAEQEAEKICQQHPFVRQVLEKTGHARTLGERRKQELEDGNHGKSDDGDLERVMMKDRYTDQRQCEQNEIDRYAGDRRRLRQGADRSACYHRSKRCDRQNRCRKTAPASERQKVGGHRWPIERAQQNNKETFAALARSPNKNSRWCRPALLNDADCNQWRRSGPKRLICRPQPLVGGSFDPTMKRR